MNPIKNKKDLETSINEIKKFAYAYLEKYSSSKQQLRIYLFKIILILLQLSYKIIFKIKSFTKLSIL